LGHSEVHCDSPPFPAANHSVFLSLVDSTTKQTSKARVHLIWSIVLQLAVWKTCFKASIAVWNAGLLNPFASSTLMAKEVQIIWKLIFGKTSPLDEDDSCWYFIESVVHPC
jgi:hypothetical protein